MASRITTNQLDSKLKDYVTNNSKEHKQLHARVSDLSDAVKENRQMFTERMDRLDHRIWAIVMLTLGSLMASVLTMIVS
jgi:hypothetical protein